MTVNIKKLLNGMVSLRDYIVRDCIKKGIPLRVIHGGLYMILSPTELETERFQLTRRVFKSKFGDRNYQLFDYSWKPVNEVE